MADDVILIEDRERVRYLTINRPAKRNAITVDQLGSLIDIALGANDDPSVGAVVIRGEGKAFCAGIDIDPSQMDMQYDTRTLQQELRLLEPFRRLDDLWRSPTPVIASVHGYCLGVGTDLAFHSDIVVCAEDARFGYPIVRSMGSPPTHMWTYLAGPQWAKRMLLTGDLLTGIDAARLGLVMDAVPAAELDTEVLALARRMALVDHHLLAANKRQVNLALELMGARTMQRLAAEIDVRGHQSRAMREFGRVAADEGMAAAVRARDEPFGDSVIRVRHARGAGSAAQS
jgi:enoyl-CoA hydratase